MTLLAWRNVWRNGRRSALTIASIACGLAAIMFGQSLIKTIQYQLIEKATGVISGHLQVQAADTQNYKFPETHFGDVDRIERALAALPQLAAFQSRILVTGLVSSRAESNGVLICGVQPGRDERVTTLSGYLNAGTYLTGRPREIVLGDSLAQMLGVGLGETVVLLAQSADGSMGAEKFILVGTYHTGSQSFDKQIVYVPLASLQEALSLEGRANNVVARLRDPERLEEARAAVADALRGLPVQVLTWREVDEELVGVQKYQNAILQIALFIVFAIVALGIVNTLLMSTFERVREFGILRAIGARPRFILRLIVLESCVLGFFGAAAGLAAGCGLVAYYGQVGLELPLGEALSYFLPFDTNLRLRFDWPTHGAALAAVLATSVAAALPAALRSARLRPVECLRSR